MAFEILSIQILFTVFKNTQRDITKENNRISLISAIVVLFFHFIYHNHILCFMRYIGKKKYSDCCHFFIFFTFFYVFFLVSVTLSGRQMTSFNSPFLFFFFIKACITFEHNSKRKKNLYKTSLDYFSLKRDNNRNVLDHWQILHKKDTKKKKKKEEKR